jgi:alkylated DNA repair protein (DNA oxidative demethylase)
MIEGFRFLPEHLSATDQQRLLNEVLARTERSPFYHAQMPRTGAPMSVAMTNFGPLGWVSDIAGYRYQATHPVTGQAWPDIPQMLLDLWDDLAGYDAPPQACLVNNYQPGARLGLHIDGDEAAKTAPVLSVSLGDRALFRLGGLKRTDPTSSMRLASGDVVLLAGAARRAYHGVDRILPGSSRLVPGGGRINLTLRRVTQPDQAQTRQGSASAHS